MSTLGFLWKAAGSVVGSSPLLASHLLLRCKTSQLDSSEGSKNIKVGQTSICQFCGNPWSSGKYRETVRKRFKNSKKISKLLDKESVSPEKLSSFEKHLLREWKTCKSLLEIKCSICAKATRFSTDLPGKAAVLTKISAPKTKTKTAQKIKDQTDLLGKKKKKKCRKDPTAGLKLPVQNVTASSPVLKPAVPVSATSALNESKNSLKAKNKLHAVFKTMEKSQEKRGSIQDFLSSL